MLLIRVILPVGILAGLIWAHVRITIANRTKVNLPADIKALIAGLTHQVSEYEETLNRHMAKHAGRQRLAAKAAEKAEDAAAVVGVPAQVAPLAPQVGGYIPTQIWQDADAGQRAAWEAFGLQSA